jgi:hypothetical protein
LGAATLAGQGGALVRGSLAASLGTLQGTGSGLVPATGTATIPLSALSLNAAGFVAVRGSLSRTLGDLELEAIASTPIAGSLAAMLGDLVLEGSAGVVAAGSADILLEPLTLFAEARGGELPVPESIDLVGLIDATADLRGTIGAPVGLVAVMPRQAVSLSGRMITPTLIGRRVTTVSLQEDTVDV